MIVWEVCKPENKLYHSFYFCCVIQGQHSLISPRGPDPPETDSSLTSHDFVIWTQLLSSSSCQFIYILSIKPFSASVSPIYFHCLHEEKTLFYVCHKDLKLQVQNLSFSFKPQLYKGHWCQYEGGCFYIVLSLSLFIVEVQKQYLNLK